MFTSNFNLRLLNFDPEGEFGNPQALSFDPWIDKHGCRFNHATDRQDRIHFACNAYPTDGDLYPLYAAFSLQDGSLLVQPEQFEQMNIFYDAYAEHSLAYSNDGTVWVLWSLECDYGVCPLLYRRNTGGQWLGPYFAGQARGHTRIAVDPAGRLHLIYITDMTEKGKTGPAPVYHTMMEVTP